MVDATITLSGNQAYISGVFPVSVVRKTTSHYLEGFQFTPAFKQRRWDGRRHFFNLTTNSFPIGLVSDVEKVLRDKPKSRVQIIDNRTKPAAGSNGFDLIGIEFGKGKFDYQLAGARALVKGERGILKIATNGGKTEVAAAVTQHLALPTLFLVERLELLRQTRRRFAARLNIPEETIGYVGDGECTIGDWITVATPTSLSNRLSLPEVQTAISRWQVIFCDECHHVASDTFYDLLARLPAYFRFGLSGTPLNRSDGADMRLIAQTGPVLFDVPNRLLIERGISVQPKLEMLKIEEPKLHGDLPWATVQKLGVTENEALNTAVVDHAIKNADSGKQVVIMVEQVKHGKTILKALKDKKPGFRTQYITGKDDLNVREKALQDFRDRKLRCLIATSILDEGVDVPNIEVLILAAGGKSRIRLLQRVGRGLRQEEGKDHLRIIDFANFSHKWLVKHSLERLKAYKTEECFKISVAEYH